PVPCFPVVWLEPVMKPHITPARHRNVCFLPVRRTAGLRKHYPRLARIVHKTQEMKTDMNDLRDAPETCAPKRAGALRGGLLGACLGLLLPLVGCGDGESLELSVSGPAAELQPMSRYAIVVYGYDITVADVP